MSQGNDSEGSRTYSEYPEVVAFEGTGDISMLQHHLIALSLVALGVVFAILAPPGGYIALAIFILISAGYELFFLRKASKILTISLYLRSQPVRAMLGDFPLGEIAGGTIIEDMDSPLELGYRPTPNKKLKVWTFSSEEDAKLVARRLLEYLPREG